MLVSIHHLNKNFLKPTDKKTDHIRNKTVKLYPRELTTNDKRKDNLYPNIPIKAQNYMKCLSYKRVYLTTPLTLQEYMLTWLGTESRQ